MANICCDDVIFYTEGNPEGLYDLWEDLETYIILNQNPDLCWIGNLFSHKKIDSTGISLRGNVSYMEWNDTYILLSLETAWTPLYEAYQAIAAAYHVPFVMQSIEPGERIYYNTDEAHLFFPDRYCVRLYEESLLTPCGLIIGEKLEDGEPFETETDVLERFRDCGYPAANRRIELPSCPLAPVTKIVFILSYSSNFSSPFISSRYFSARSARNELICLIPSIVSGLISFPCIFSIRKP